MAEPSPAKLEDDEEPDVYNAPAAAPAADDEPSTGDADEAAAEAKKAEALAAAAAATAAEEEAAAAAAAARAKADAAAQAEAAAKAEAEAAAAAVELAMKEAEADAAAAEKAKAESAGDDQAGEAAAVVEAAVDSSVDLEDGSAAERGEHFVQVVSECGKEVGGRLATLGTSEVRDGMWTLARRYADDSKGRLESFKEHALDLAQTATSPAPEGSSVIGSLRKEVRWGQVAQLPIGALYALLAVIFLTVFAAVHFPQKYLPIGVAYTKKKLVEYKVQEKSTAAALALKTHAQTAFKAAADSPQAAKALETAHSVRIKVHGAVTSAATGAVGAKADALRLNLGEKLSQMRQKEPTAATATPASPDGEEKVTPPRAPAKIRRACGRCHVSPRSSTRARARTLLCGCTRFHGRVCADASEPPDTPRERIVSCASAGLSWTARHAALVISTSRGKPSRGGAELRPSAACG